MDNVNFSNELVRRENLIRLRESKYAEIKDIDEKIKEVERDDFKKNSQKYIGKIFKISQGEFYRVRNYDPYSGKLIGALIKWSLTDISFESDLAIDLEDIGVQEVDLEEVKSSIDASISWIMTEFSE